MHNMRSFFARNTTECLTKDSFPVNSNVFWQNSANGCFANKMCVPSKKRGTVCRFGMTRRFLCKRYATKKACLKVVNKRTPKVGRFFVFSVLFRKVILRHKQKVKMFRKFFQKSNQRATFDKSKK